MMTSRNDSPSVSGTNRKWYIAVRANCSRDSSTTPSSMTQFPRSAALNTRRRPRAIPIYSKMRIYAFVAG